MASEALIQWHGKRAEHIDELLSVHVRVVGAGRGRHSATTQLNLAVLLRLAAEFQGFCRDLHDLASDEFASRVGGPNARLQQLVASQLTRGRKLNGGNANPGNIGSDYARLGLDLWPELAKRRPRRAPAWNRSLSAMNEARNGVAHDDQAALARVAKAGYHLSALSTIKNFRRDAAQVAVLMDDVVAEHLPLLFGGDKPW